MYFRFVWGYKSVVVHSVIRDKMHEGEWVKTKMLTQRTPTSAVKVGIWFFWPQCLDASGSVIYLVVVRPRSGHRSPASAVDMHHLGRKDWNWCDCRNFANGHLVTLDRQPLLRFRLQTKFAITWHHRLQWWKCAQKRHLMYLYVFSALATVHRSHDQKLAPVF